MAVSCTVREGLGKRFLLELVDYILEGLPTMILLPGEEMDEVELYEDSLHPSRILQIRAFTLEFNGFTITIENDYICILQQIWVLPYIKNMRFGHTGELWLGVSKDNDTIAQGLDKLYKLKGKIFDTLRIGCYPEAWELQVLNPRRE